MKKNVEKRQHTAPHSRGEIQIQRIKTKNENKNATGEATYGGALRAPLAGSPDCVFAFVFVLIYVLNFMRTNLDVLG